MLLGGSKYATLHPSQGARRRRNKFTFDAADLCKNGCVGNELVENMFHLKHLKTYERKLTNRTAPCTKGARIAVRANLRIRILHKRTRIILDKLGCLPSYLQLPASTTGICIWFHIWHMHPHLHQSEFMCIHVSTCTSVHLPAFICRCLSACACITGMFAEPFGNG